MKQLQSDIKSGSHGKAGILVGKVIGIIGKGASGKVIREGILNNFLEKRTTVQESSSRELNTNQ